MSPLASSRWALASGQLDLTPECPVSKCWPGSGVVLSLVSVETPTAYVEPSQGLLAVSVATSQNLSDLWTVAQVRFILEWQ